LSYLATCCLFIYLFIYYYYYFFFFLDYVFFTCIYRIVISAIDLSYGHLDQLILASPSLYTTSWKPPLRLPRGGGCSRYNIIISYRAITIPSSTTFVRLSSASSTAVPSSLGYTTSVDTGHPPTHSTYRSSATVVRDVALSRVRRFLFVGHLCHFVSFGNVDVCIINICGTFR
jgi:hypothetical protein